MVTFSRTRCKPRSIGGRLFRAPNVFFTRVIWCWLGWEDKSVCVHLYEYLLVICKPRTLRFTSTRQPHRITLLPLAPVTPHVTSSVSQSRSMSFCEVDLSVVLDGICEVLLPKDSEMIFCVEFLSLPVKGDAKSETWSDLQLWWSSSHCWNISCDIGR